MPRLPVALPRPEALRLLLKLNALLLRHPPLFRALLRHPPLFRALLRHLHLITECPLRALLRYRVGHQQWLFPRPCLV